MGAGLVLFAELIELGYNIFIRIYAIVFSDVVRKAE
jgi:hypothetical protein